MRKQWTRLIVILVACLRVNWFMSYVMKMFNPKTTDVHEVTLRLRLALALLLVFSPVFMIPSVRSQGFFTTTQIETFTQSSLNPVSTALVTLNSTAPLTATATLGGSQCSYSPVEIQGSSPLLEIDGTMKSNRTIDFYILTQQQYSIFSTSSCNGPPSQGLLHYHGNTYEFHFIPPSRTSTYYIVFSAYSPAPVLVNYTVVIIIPLMGTLGTSQATYAYGYENMTTVTDNTILTLLKSCDLYQCATVSLTEQTYYTTRLVIGQLTNTITLTNAQTEQPSQSLPQTTQTASQNPIPGFSLESVVLGLFIGFGLLIIIRRRTVR